MAKILTKKWKDFKAKKLMCLLSLEERKKVREERKQKAKEAKGKAEEIREKKRAYFNMLKQKKEEKRAKKSKGKPVG